MDEKPGFWDNLGIFAETYLRNPVSELVSRLTRRSTPN